MVLLETALGGGVASALPDGVADDENENEKLLALGLIPAACELLLLLLMLLLLLL